MEGFKGSVQRSDSKNMPQLLDQVSDARENEASRHFAISLYGELAQVHKQAIIPYIPRMMASIVRSLPFSADSHQLHEACAKAVASVARYTIDPTRPYDCNQQILFNLCSPLLPVLASKLESSAAGAAICLQAVVESEKWKFAHPDLQGLICTKATAALSERGVHTVTFLHLVKSLAKFSKDASQCHIVEWLRTGLRVLQTDLGMPGSWQQRIVAAQLIAVILKTVDVDKLGLDMHETRKILEAYRMDKVSVVQIAVDEALETIKGVALGKGMHHDLADLSCESKGRSSDTEELGQHELSGSISPRSHTSSHEAVPSMASSTVEFGTGLKCMTQHSRNSLCLSSHASLNLSRPSKHKENTPATIPRRVLSEIPVSGKLSSNSEVLPSSCPSKPLSRSSVDPGSKMCDHLMQDKGFFGSGKGNQCVDSQIHNCAMNTSSSVRKLIEGCQNCSDVGCTCMLKNEEYGSNNQLASTDHLSCMADSQILEEHNDCIEEGMHKLAIKSSCRTGCVNDDCGAGVRSSGCTEDVLLGTHATVRASTESLTIAETGSHLQVNKLPAPTDDFTFRAPCILLHSLQSSSSTENRGESCRKCTDSDSHIPKEASWMGSDDPASGESKESHVVATDYESRHETSGASSCVVEHVDSSGDSGFKSGLRTHKQILQKINKLDGKRMSVELNDHETYASGHKWSSSRDTSDSGFGDDEKVRNRQSRRLHRSLKKSGARKSFTAHKMEGHTKSPAGPDGKSRGVDQSGKEFILSEPFKKQTCGGNFLGLACAIAILVLAAMVIQHVNRIYELHALVPT